MSLLVKLVRTDMIRIPLSLRYDKKSMTVWMMSPSAILRAPVKVKQQSDACYVKLVVWCKV